MSLENLSMIKRMQIDKNHVDNYVLETTEGTKRTREKFHRMACNNRNNYINNQINVFNRYLFEIKNEMTIRVNKMLPKDRNHIHNRNIAEVNNLLNLVKLNSNISNSFKLKIDFIIASIKDDTSLEELNNIINNFIVKFKELGINLTIEDFKYTMFTEEYMLSFFVNSDFEVMKEVFEKIYFTCPDIKLHLKMNLYDIVDKYQKTLEKCVISIKNELFTTYSVNENNVIDKYISTRYEVGNKIATDEYNNTKLFLDNKKHISDYVESAPVRVKNYDMFAINNSYNSLDNDGKNTYNSAIMGLYLTLNMLKKYYHYEFILKDLLERNKNKEAAKNQYATKKKEIEKEEKNRMDIYKKYLKASGIGFLARKKEVKMKDLMLKMNEEINKLHTLYDELRDLEITCNLNNLNESASIYDLFIMSLSSFSFLEKCFDNNELFSEEKLDDIIEEYFKFLYNPNNNILRKTNVFTDYNIVDIVSEKYKLLNLNVSSDMIDSDNIDSTLDTLSYINLIQNIERSHISVKKIAVLCKMYEILELNKTSEDVV